MDEHWSLVYRQYVPEQEGLREALCTLGNGYFATRGATCESTANGVHYPGNYQAGCYNRLKTEIAGRTIENEDLVNLPNWLPITFRINQERWFSLRDVVIEEYRQELRLHEGMLQRLIRFCDHAGRSCRLEERRIVHMYHYHLAAIEWTLVAEDWSGEVEICSALDGTVVNTGVKRYRALNNTHIRPLETEWLEGQTIFLKVETTQSEVRIAQAARHRITVQNTLYHPEQEVIEKDGYIALHQRVKVSRGDRLTMEKIVSQYSSRDRAISECGLAAKQAVHTAAPFSALLASHRKTWESLWRLYDVGLEATSWEAPYHPLLIVRLHLFHLLQTASPHTIDLDAGIPARGWHGEAYRGHIFWDELFIFPLLNLRMPKLSSALLGYRYRRLEMARFAAQQEGLRGAMYPWQSGSDGREESQQVHLNPRSGRWVPDESSRQRHVNAAIAYNIWQYYQVTKDVDFLIAHGAEIILELARFWVSLAKYNAQIDRYEILGVMGPDEYHDAQEGLEGGGVRNNAYTNLMAVWVLCRALEVLDLLAADHEQELCTKLGINEEEIGLWDRVSRRMYLPFHGDGILSQFEGYGELKELDWEVYRQKYGDISRLDRILEMENDSANRYQVSKQADVLMLFYLFSTEELEELFTRLEYPFAPDMIQKSIEYYMHRTVHGSTLSRLVHSWVLARADRPASWELFLDSLESDVADIQQGTTPEGIHLGAMAGTIDLLQRGYAGVSAVADVLWFNPQLPDVLRWLAFTLQYRMHSLEVDINWERLSVRSRDTVAPPIVIGFRDKTYEIAPGQAMEFSLER